MAIDPRCEVDVMMGTGGTPEGVLSAIAIRIMGGEMFAKLDPQKQDEKNALAEFGMDVRRVLTVKDLVKSDDLFFAATGISGGTFLKGVAYHGHGAETSSPGHARQDRHHPLRRGPAQLGLPDALQRRGLRLDPAVDTFRRNRAGTAMVPALFFRLYRHKSRDTAASPFEPGPVICYACIMEDQAMSRDKRKHNQG